MTNARLPVFDAPATRERLAFEPLIARLRQFFAEGCEVPLRHRHDIAVPGGEGGTLLLMPAWRPGGLLGLKAVSIYPGNAARGLPGLHAAYLLMDATTGAPLALMDGNEITSRRTAAASALAAQCLSRPDATRLLVVGAGRVARLLPAAYRTVRDIREVAVWARRPEAARALAAEFAGEGFSVQVADDLGSAVRACDIVSCATLSRAPLIRGEWLVPGQHVDLIGAFTPDMRESDDACLARARVFVDTDEAPAKAGDLLLPIASGAFRAESVEADLADLCTAAHPGRNAGADITLFKSVGSALEDLAAASLVWEHAND